MATFYFNAGVDNEWQTLGNWWMDDNFTTQATALPTSVDDVIATASITSNSGSEPTVANFTFNDPNGNGPLISISITVTGDATFNDSSSNGGTVTGDATFNDISYHGGGTVSGNATFNDSSFNYGTAPGNATFNDNSYNYGYVTGNATFNGSSINDAIVTGDATFNDNSYLSVYGSVNGTSTFNDASYMEPNNTNYTNNPWTVVLGTRTPYPLRYGINNSNILGMI